MSGWFDWLKFNMQPTSRKCSFQDLHRVAIKCSLSINKKSETKGNLSFKERSGDFNIGVNSNQASYGWSSLHIYELTMIYCQIKHTAECIFSGNLFTHMHIPGKCICACKSECFLFSLFNRHIQICRIIMG